MRKIGWTRAGQLLAAANMTGLGWWLFVCLFASRCCHAAVITWIGPVKGDFSQESNWSPREVPGFGDDVVLPRGSSPVLSSVVLVASLRAAPGVVLSSSDGVVRVLSCTNLQLLFGEGDDRISISS